MLYRRCSKLWLRSRYCGAIRVEYIVVLLTKIFPPTAAKALGSCGTDEPYDLRCTAIFFRFQVNLQRSVGNVDPALSGLSCQLKFTVSVKAFEISDYVLRVEYVRMLSKRSLSDTDGVFFRLQDG